MTKKHKSKGGNQQKARKKPSFRNESHSHAQPSFSLRDEVTNTERHHSEWSPATKLRDQTIRFVSAGSLHPLDEAKIEEGGQKMENKDNVPPPAVKETDKEDTTQAPIVIEDRLDTDLKISEGAMAQMTIDSLNEPVVPSENHFEIDETSMDIEEPKDIVSTDGAMEDLGFVIDIAGDSSLRPTGSAPKVRDVSPARSSSSEDEVILFRGRNDPVTIRDDPVSRHTKPQSKPANVSKRPLNATPHVTDLLIDVMTDKTPSKTSIPQTPKPQPRPSASQPTKASANGWANVAPTFAPAGEPDWVHSDGSRGLPTGSAVPPDAWDFQDTQSRKGKKSRKRDNKKFRRMEQELADEIMQDYVDNMSEGEIERISGLKTSLDDDDWVSSEMSESEATTKVKGSKKRTKRSKEPVVDADTISSTIDPDELPDDEDDDEDDEGAFDDSDLTDDSEQESGDDTDLEEEIEYNEREMWEDEADLRRRQRDAMTDEEIARLLAKQEELGISGDELFLYDDSGFGDLETARAGLDTVMGNQGRTRRSKRGGRRSDHFPSASLMADVLEQDPYGGFDIMDFDRPSLKNKPKGRKSLPDQLMDLSDEELVADLQTSWQNDRKKKASKKAEREELRSMGLLGSGRKKGRVDMDAKYNEGMNLSALRIEIRDFLEAEDDNSKAFPPMDKTARKVLHDIANGFNISSKSRGSGKNRFTVLNKTRRTLDWDEQAWSLLANRSERGFLPNMRSKGKGAGGGSGRKVSGRATGGGANAAAGYRHGEVVGATAPEIAESNFGRKLMEKMGWSKGMALGNQDNVEGRLLEPVVATIKSGRGGLG